MYSVSKIFYVSVHWQKVKYVQSIAIFVSILKPINCNMYVRATVTQLYIDIITTIKEIVLKEISLLFSLTSFSFHSRHSPASSLAGLEISLEIAGS